MNAEADQLPPHDVANEQGVLACIMMAPRDCMAESVAKIPDALAFYDLRHQILFETLRAMHRRSEPIDVITVQHRLKEKSQLENAGGIAYLAELPDKAPSAANLSFYISKLRENYTQRRILQTCTEAAVDVQAHPEHTAQILRAMEATVQHLQREIATEDTAIDAADFVSAPRVVPPEIISSVLHKGSKLVLGGGSKSFKTWVQLDAAVSVSHGVPWLGRETIKSRVLFVNLEIQAPFFAERVQRVAQAKGVTLERGQLLIRNLRGQAAHFRTVLPEIERAAKGEGVALIVLDPIYKLYGGADENSAGDVAELLNGLERLAVSTGAAVAFGAHFSKGNQAGKESIDRISGSGVFARDPDSILIFTKHEEENAFTVDATLRNLAPVDPFVVRWDFPLMRPDENLDPSRLKKPAGRGKEHSADELLTSLPRSGLSTTDWVKAAEDESGIKDRTFYRLKSELLAAGRIRKDKISSKWLQT